MRQLTGLDASFLNMETSRTYGHVAGLMIFEPPENPRESPLEAARRTIRERIHLLPVYRQKLVEIPLGLDFPYWVNDPDLDLDFHIRHTAVAPPGNDHQLAALVSRLHAIPLDRSRPLWEVYVIEGLEGGRFAHYTKFHHCAIDGASGASILTVLLDFSPEGQEIPQPTTPWVAEEVPTDLELLTRGAIALAGKPAHAVQWAYRAVRALPLGNLLPSVSDLRRRALGPREGDIIEKPVDPVPITRLNKTISAQRRFAFGRVPLEDLKIVKNHYGTTLNDVVMALSAGTLRRWFLDHGALPDGPLYAGVPISLRTEAEKDAMGNRVSMMIAAIGTHLADPVERLRFCQEEMKVAKETHGAMPADILTDVTQILPPALFALAARVAARTRVADFVTPPMNVAISNVPGPREPLYSCGARVVGNYPVSMIADGGALNITVSSLGDGLDVGFLACRSAVPDVWNMVGYFKEELAELKALAEGSGAHRKGSKPRLVPKVRPATKMAKVPARG